MAKRPSVFRPAGRPAPEQSARETDRRRGSARARGYDTAWGKASAGYLRDHPLCEYCEAGAFADARISPATLVDHLFPHRGDRDLFWNRGLWVACCTPCHSGPKQALERKGSVGLAALARRLGRPEGGGSKV